MVAVELLLDGGPSFSSHMRGNRVHMAVVCSVLLGFLIFAAVSIAGVCILEKTPVVNQVAECHSQEPWVFADGVGDLTVFPPTGWVLLEY
ncbi:hypothetical protein OIE13_30330 [Streptosporangium sp. NBC_01810]|uniref:hypothetical protein n=1 Tax=Streptosporangium sp. NBC_01810 TaxID=2975951 RepID=UPI002DDB5C44|nr:hypothetical protein [Streptosporangium sp. NBC_01810]WSA25185.1 hypothetical protein OIE13_30330 [Streptosporangium sp. NBC_01810]